MKFVLLACLLAGCASVHTDAVDVVDAAAFDAPILEGGMTDYVMASTEARGDFDVDDLAWLTGRWVGEGLGGLCEETWNPPIDGVMVGTFRLFENSGAINFYEFLTLVRDERGVALKLIHLSPELRPWEEPGQTTEFRLIDVDETTAWFGGLTLHRAGDRLAVHIGMSTQAGGLSDVALFLERRAL